MRRKIHRAPMAVASALLLGVFATSCSTEDPTDSGSGTDDSSETSESPDASESPDEGGEQEWFDQAVYDEQYEQRSATFEGDAEAVIRRSLKILGELTERRHELIWAVDPIQRYLKLVGLTEVETDKVAALTNAYTATAP